jgi:hypothetical protein
VGVLAETAQGLAWKAYSDWDDQQPKDVRIAKWAESIRLAEEDCLKKGVTSFEDAGSSFEQVEGMKQLASREN